MPGQWSYIRLDDHIDENEKIGPLSDAGFRLYITSLCYCSRNLTDGRIPKPTVPRLEPRRTARVVAELVKAGLWSDHGNHYEVHDYLEHQRSREQIETERSRWRDRQARHRDVTRDKTVTSPGVTGESPEDHRGVTQTETETETETEAETEAFGDGYPSQIWEGGAGGNLVDRLVAACSVKDRGEAERVVQALGEYVDPALIDEAVGWALDANGSTPSRPRYFLKVVADWARQRGVQVPDLQLKGARS